MLNEYCHKYVWDTRVDHNSKEKVFREAWKKMQFFMYGTTPLCINWKGFKGVRIQEYI